MKRKTQKANPSVLSEILGGIAGVFLGDASSFGKSSGKITIALLFLMIGIACMIRPVIHLDGTEIKKEIIPCVIGSVFILTSVILVISWLRKRKTNQD